MMEYMELVEDLLSALADGDADGVADCSEILWNLCNVGIDIKQREMVLARSLLDELEILEF